MALPFAVSAATVIGGMHYGAKTNNQDGYTVIEEDDFIVAGVADGCGAGDYTEVGSRLGITFLVNGAASMLRQNRRVEWGKLLHRYNRFVVDAANAMCPTSQEHFDRLITSFFMHTVILTVIHRAFGGYVTLARFGDGYAVLNGKNVFVPFAKNNHPLVPMDLIKHEELWWRIREVRTVGLRKVKSLLVATDGFADVVASQHKRLPGRTERVGNVNRLWHDKTFATEPGKLGRYLHRIGTAFPPSGSAAPSEPGHLRDDTTIVLIVRTK